MMHVLLWLPLSLAGGALLLVLFGMMWYGLDQLVLWLYAASQSWMVKEPLTLTQSFSPWHVVTHGFAMIRLVSSFYVTLRAQEYWWTLIGLAGATLAATMCLSLFAVQLAAEWLEMLLTIVQRDGVMFFQSVMRLVCLALTFWLGFPVIWLLLTADGSPAIRAMTAVMAIGVLSGAIYLITAMFRPCWLVTAPEQEDA